MTSHKSLDNNRGMAVLITVAVISVLIVTTLELNRRAQTVISSVNLATDRITLEQMAASAIHLGMAILIHDKADDPPSGLDSLHEDWADPEYIAEALSVCAFEKGTLAMKITDELSKIQINSIVKFPDGKEANDLQMFLLDRFLTLMVDSGQGFEDIEPRTIVNSVKDWLDSGDDNAVTGINGAETDFYESLDPPYQCKNGPISHLGELVLINGFTPELYYGIEGLFGLSNYITTTFGPLFEGGEDFYRGEININTADLLVIASLLPDGDKMLASSIYDYREESYDEDNLDELSDPTWYKNAPGLSDVEIDASLITTFSNFFQIKAVATLEKTSVSITAVVERVKNDSSGKWTCKLLSYLAE